MLKNKNNRKILKNIENNNFIPPAIIIIMEFTNTPLPEVTINIIKAIALRKVSTVEPSNELFLKNLKFTKLKGLFIK